MSELFNDVSAFEAIEDREYVEIETGWSKEKKVRLRSLTAEEFAKCDEFVFEQTQKQKLANLTLCLLGQQIVDAENKPIFKSIAQGEAVLAKRNPKFLRKLMEAGRKLTPVSEFDYRALEAEVENIAGNSETPPADSSIS